MGLPPTALRSSLAPSPRAASTSSSGVARQPPEDQRPVRGRGANIPRQAITAAQHRQRLRRLLLARPAGSRRSRAPAVGSPAATLMITSASPVCERGICSGSTASRSTRRAFVETSWPRRPRVERSVTGSSSPDADRAGRRASVSAESGTSWRWAIFTAVSPSTWSRRPRPGAVEVGQLLRRPGARRCRTRGPAPGARATLQSAVPRLVDRHHGSGEVSATAAASALGLRRRCRRRRSGVSGRGDQILNGERAEHSREAAVSARARG